MVAATVLLAGCGETDRPGRADVYEQIQATSDCDALQETFDRNMDDVERRDPGDPLREATFSYATAANNRMDQLGCFG
jgi:hypothetical protein